MSIDKKSVNTERETLIAQDLDAQEGRRDSKKEQSLTEYNNIVPNYKLPEFPCFDDLKSFSKIRLKKKRLAKKFSKDFSRYISDDVFIEYMVKSVCRPLLRRIDYQKLGRMLVNIDPLPQGAYKIFNTTAKYGDK